MKSEWEFKFEARNFRFEKEHKFQAITSKPIALGDRPPEKIEFFIRVVPDDAKPPPHIDQIGSLFITLPHSEVETKPLAYQLVGVIAERVAFQSGDFRINYGLVICKRIAETPEEEEEFGDKLYSMEFQLEEVVPPPLFDANTFAQASTQSQNLWLISQYNETKKDSSPIRQFLGFFRILESLYHSEDKKQSLKQAFSSDTELRDIYISLAKGGDFKTFVKNIVEIRHKCAHLKLSDGFGYVPLDPAIESEVMPHLALLAMIANICITRIANSGK